MAGVDGRELAFEIHGDDLASLESAFEDGFTTLTEPLAVAFLVERPEFLSVYFLSQVADLIHSEANAHKWMALFGKDTHRRVFFLEDQECLQKARDMWGWESEVVAYDVCFTVEAVADSGAPREANEGGIRGGWEPQSLYIDMEGLFQELQLPPDTRQRKVSDSVFELIVRRPADDDARALRAGVCEEVLGWLNAYTFLSGVALRLRVDGSMSPVCRRLSGWRVGVEHRIAPLPPRDELQRVGGLLASADDATRRALAGLNESLCAPSPMARLMTLWRTVEDVLPRCPSSLLTEKEKKSLKQAIRAALPREKADSVFESACRLGEKRPNEEIAEALVPFAGGVKTEEVARLVGEYWRARGRAAHTLKEAEEVGPAIAFLQAALARFISTQCGLTRDGQPVVPEVWVHR